MSHKSRRPWTAEAETSNISKGTYGLGIPCTPDTALGLNQANSGTNVASVLVQRKQREGNKAIDGIPETRAVLWRVMGPLEASRSCRRHLQHSVYLCRENDMIGLKVLEMSSLSSPQPIKLPSKMEIFMEGKTSSRIQLERDRGDKNKAKSKSR